MATLSLLSQPPARWNVECGLHGPKTLVSQIVSDLNVSMLS